MQVLSVGELGGFPWPLISAGPNTGLVMQRGGEYGVYASSIYLCADANS